MKYTLLTIFFLFTLILSSCDDPLPIEIDEPDDTFYISGIPSIIIDTEQPLNSITKETWVNASIKTVNKSYETNINNFIPVQIKGRGNSTWNDYPKKPYNLKFIEKQAFLGLPKDKRWVLLANYRDKTLLRNELAFEISRRTDLRWTPRTAFAELYINDNHLGNYQICEQIEISKEKININKKTGILFELDKNFDEVWKFKTERCSLPVMIKEPDIDNQILTELQDYFNNVEKVLYSENFKNEKEGYRKYIDVNSFIDWYLVYEVMGNEEPFHPKSVFLFRNDDMKLEMGPVWDFDWSTCMNKEGLLINNTIWYGRLFEDPFFRTTLYYRWETLMFKLLDINDFIDTKGSYLKLSQTLNCDKWNLNDTDLIGTNYGSYDEYLNALKEFFNFRINWLDKAFKDLRDK